MKETNQTITVFKGSRSRKKFTRVIALDRYEKKGDQPYYIVPDDVDAIRTLSAEGYCYKGTDYVNASCNLADFAFIADLKVLDVKAEPVGEAPYGPVEKNTDEAEED